MIYSKFIKGILDRLVALALLVLLSPVFIVIGVVVKFTQNGAVLFCQKRTGLHMRRFIIYKFRTLVPSPGSSLSLSNRQFTYAGKFLRTSGLDELPQLFNILKGEMSFVGPRPMPVEYESKYLSEHLKRFNVKPGITGWAQVNGRNNSTWRGRFDFDCWYVDQQSIWIDLKVIWETIYKVISLTSGEKGHEMPVFTGKNLD